MKFLIVEDEIRIREGIRRLLPKLDPENEIAGEAENGERGLALIQKLRPDVIITDVRMPVMDGLTAAKTIRAAARADAKTIPIIAMTANAFQEDQEQCYKAGMNAHLAKPLNMEKVIRTIYEQCSYKLNGRQQNKKPNL